MATPTYDLISEQVLAATAASVTFSSIPATYTDLVLEVSKASSPTSTLTSPITFNADSGSNYSQTRLYATTGVGSDRATSATYLYGIEANDATLLSASTLSIQSYANTNVYKTVIIRTNTPTTGVFAMAGMWRSLAAINSITIANGGTNVFSVGSTFRLWGIA